MRYLLILIVLLAVGCENESQKLQETLDGKALLTASFKEQDKKGILFTKIDHAIINNREGIQSEITVNPGKRNIIFSYVSNKHLVNNKSMEAVLQANRSYELMAEEEDAVLLDKTIKKVKFTLVEKLSGLHVMETEAVAHVFM